VDDKPCVTTEAQDFSNTAASLSRRADSEVMEWP
jgi:hypothetical protein